MKKKQILNMVVTAMLIAIIVVMAFIPFLGFIGLGGFTITLIYIPVMIGTVLFGVKQGGVLGFAFGICSLILAYIRPSSVTDYIFQNPLVSVLPRVVFGLVVGLMIRGLLKLRVNRYLSVGITTFISILFHAFITVSFMAIFGMESINEVLGTTNYFKILGAFIGFAGLIEATICTIIVSAIYAALVPALKNTSIKILEVEEKNKETI